MQKLKYCKFCIVLTVFSEKSRYVQLILGFSWRGMCVPKYPPNILPEQSGEKLGEQKVHFQIFNGYPLKIIFIPCVAYFSVILSLKWRQMINWSTKPKTSSQHAHLLPKESFKLILDLGCKCSFPDLEPNSLIRFFGSSWPMCPRAAVSLTLSQNLFRRNGQKYISLHHFFLLIGERTPRLQNTV